MACEHAVVTDQRLAPKADSARSAHASCYEIKGNRLLQKIVLIVPMSSFVEIGCQINYNIFIPAAPTLQNRGLLRKNATNCCV